MFEQPKVEPRQTKTITRVKDMTELDMLSHNFTGDPALTDYFLVKYGQCFVNGERITEKRNAL